MTGRALRRALLGAWMGVATLAAPASAQLLVAAAADLQAVLPDIGARFQRASGQPLRVTYGSSGQFVAQIQNGAPFDLFLSADETFVRRLVESGHAEASSVAPYALGRLALWARTDRHLDLGQGLALLTSPAVRRIAIANPQHAPYGRAAVDAIRHAGLYDRVQTRLVLGENVSQAAQFAQSGNADVGIIALSLTLAPAMRASGTAVELPSDSFAPITQTGVVLTASRQRELARRFLQFLSQPDIAQLLRDSGFGSRP
jgi:molybdate transport system substrate-binding protein